MTKRFPMPMPFGWFAIGYSDELAISEIKNIYYFDREMVLFRTEAGKVSLIDPACPHLGAHLGHGGTVQGESIRCPFHHWQFDTEGVISDIPYAQRIPAKWEGKACLKTYSVCEKNNVIWAWYHPEDEAPDHDVIELTEATDPEWSEPRRYMWTIKSCPQEIAENGVDKAHFKFVHNMEAVPEGKTTYDGRVRKSSVSGVSQMVINEAGDEMTVERNVQVVQNGAGQKWTRFSGLIDYLLQVLVTPVNDELVEIRFSYTHPNWPEDSINHMIFDAAVDATNGQTGVEGDIPIWNKKFHHVNPILCDGDGPVMQFRKYFAQFYI
ncbi:Rieske 2Fe-2S domain-containing protein [Oceanicoccus sp. KOV_DT_Chl]|uniref:Rieske 2Fe-2S domain-containing protein n=1 Tax=Oceanicoccus sp. KOV_DT_Chl TaxID=1904639 RepID=UPI000C7D55A5|nr:Rieske 2Fe-2S domain-containing protein [Oceanicoccus sp. KOV_DT_Chl]